MMNDLSEARLADAKEIIPDLVPLTSDGLQGKSFC